MDNYKMKFNECVDRIKVAEHKIPYKSSGESSTEFSDSMKDLGFNYIVDC